MEAGPNFVLKWRHNFFGCPPDVDGIPVFYKLDTLYSYQHVVFAISTFGCLLSLFGHPLCEWPSPQMTHLIFALQFLAGCPKFWQL